MRATGIIRRIDDLGRVVIPKEIRRRFHIQEGDPLEILTSWEGVMFRKYNPTVSVKVSLNDLKQVVQEESDLKSKTAMLEKIKELERLLEAESEEYEKKELE